MDFVSLVLLVSICVTIFLYYANRKRKYWARRKIPSLRPINILMGSTAEVFINKVPLYNYHAKLYEQLAPHRYGGYYNFFKPMLIVRDPELVKNIFSKDFNYFMNRSLENFDEIDPLSQHLFNLKDERWRILRTKLTPTFTSGKIKIMFNLMKECTDELVKMINSEIEKEEEIDAKELMARFTTDVITSCVFGIESNSQKDPNSPMRSMGRKVFAQSIRQRIMGIVTLIFPKFREIFKIPFFPSDIEKFLKSVVTDTIKYREEHGVERNDFLDLLIALKKQETLTRNSTNGEVNNLEFTDTLLTAQCFVFFIAGFETSSSTLAFALYELAKHSEIQNKLLEEINKTLEENNGSFSYESIQQMSYLDQVVCETLRMYPLLPILTRICNDTYKLDEDHVIEKNTKIFIPVKGLHYDPQYYENPMDFNPENFCKEAKAKRHHFAFLPFGEGPRNCIGMRFGLTQVKLGLATIIHNYSVCLSPKMTDSIEFSVTSFLPTAKNGVRLKFQKRSLNAETEKSF